MMFSILVIMDYLKQENRAIIFARRIEDGEFCFKAELVKQNFNRISKRKCSLQYFKTTLEILAKEVDEKFYLSEKIKPTILSDGSANFKSKFKIDLLIARPLTASMHKCIELAKIIISVICLSEVMVT